MVNLLLTAMTVYPEKKLLEIFVNIFNYYDNSNNVGLFSNVKSVQL